MPAKVMQVFPQAALERILQSLEHELIEATDEEILEAAHALGMKPEMKGSAAFIGLRHPGARAPSSWVGPELLRRWLSDSQRIGIATAPRTAKRGPDGRRPPRPPKEPDES